MIFAEYLPRLAEANLVLSCLDVWKGPEGEGALDFADVVVQDVFSGEGLGQVEAVFDLERLAEGPLLGAGAHDAGRHAAGVTGLDVDLGDGAGHPLLPELQVDVGQGVAGHPGVQERVGNVKQTTLDRGNLVAIGTSHLNMVEHTHFYYDANGTIA